MNVRFYDKFLLHMMLPIGCLLALVLAYFSGKVCCIKRNDKGALIHMKEAASRALILIILFLFPGLSTKIFTMFKCKSIDGIGGLILVEDFTQRCGVGEHVLNAALGIVFLCFYVLGIPLTMLMLLWCNKRHLHDESSPRHRLIKSALGGLYTQYEPGYWWFEIFLLLNKTMMCGGLVMAQPGTSFQVLFSVLIMLCHLLFVVKLAPVSPGLWNF